MTRAAAPDGAPASRRRSAGVSPALSIVALALAACASKDASPSPLATRFPSLFPGRAAAGPEALPRRANQPLHVADPRSGLDIEIALEGALDALGIDDGADRVYPGAASGSDLVRRRVRGGVEDLVVFERAPAAPEVTYRIELGASVRGLRLVGRTLELLDAGGAPRLRVAPPFLEDSRGARSPASLALEGCAFDASPAPPWGRAPIAAGASSCRLRVAWDASAVTYPAVLDPLWSATADMVEERGIHTATLLADGRVLVAGGQGFSDVLTAAEVYDPGTGTWASVSPMGTKREEHTATLLATGDVLVAGGGPDSFVTALASSELFHPATGTWTPTVGPLAGARRRHTASAIAGGKVLVAGGHFSGNTELVTAEIYDPAAQTWSATAPMPSSHSQHTATVLADGRVLVAAGTDDAFAGIPTAAIYDPASGTWSATGQLAHPRQDHAATLLPSGEVLVAGGALSFFNLEPTAEIYDPALGTWKSAGDLKEPREYLTATLLSSGVVLIAGGVSDPGPMSTQGAELWAGGTTWATTTSMLFPRYSHTATRLDDGRVLLAGGWLDDSIGTYVIDKCELFTPFPSGTVCVDGAVCASGFCVDGFCCDKVCDGPCESCAVAIKGSGADGICEPLAQGTDPEADCADEGAPGCGLDGACDGAGACEKYPVSSGCEPATCTDDADCASGHCAPDDQICCATACDGECESCLGAKKGDGADGTCGPLPKGTDPDDECGSTSPDECSKIALCDGTSGCASSEIVCAPYTCQNAGACLSACTDDSACAPGYFCDGKECGATPVATCDDHIATGANGEKVDCTPYKCEADGSCRKSCGSVSDCATPNVCSADGDCVAPPKKASADDGGGCGCRAAPDEEPLGGGAAALLAAAALLTRRRRVVRGATLLGGGR